MNFFDYIKNDAFFKPLTLKYRRVYYDCIQILIDKTKELPVLYESDAKDSITAYLKNAGINEVKKDISSDINAVEEIEAGESGTELQSSGILSLFRECGWLLPREIGRNGEYIANISIDCRKLMDFLRKMTEKSGEGMMSNRIFSMYEIIKSAFEEDSVRRERPYTNILVPLIDNETELKNELTDLKDSISSIMKAVIIFQDINSFGQFIMKDEMLDRFFSEYFFVKNNGLIPAQLSFIKAKLRILRQEEACEKIIKECSEKLQLNYEEARERVERYFAELQYFLSVEYESNMELIDSRINNYYNLANTRIMLMASNGVRLESVINDFLNTVSKMTEEEQAAVAKQAASQVSASVEAQFAAGTDTYNYIYNSAVNNYTTSMSNATDQIAQAYINSDAYTAFYNAALSSKAMEYATENAPKLMQAYNLDYQTAFNQAYNGALQNAELQAGVAASVQGAFKQMAQQTTTSLAEGGKAAIGQSVVDACKSAATQAASQAAGQAAVQGAETAKATIASQIEATQANGYSLVSGANALAQGTSTLAGSIPALKNGISQLVSGANALASGAGQLKDGAVTLADGASQVADGAGTLNESLVTLNNEAIKKMISAYNGDVKDSVERLQAAMEAATEYDSFGGKSDNTAGVTKFIIKTAAIAAE